MKRLAAVALAALALWPTPVATAQPAPTQPAFTIHKVDTGSFVARTPTSPFFVLLVGNDGRPGLEGVRGDGIHIVGVNPANRSATILNIPRDTWVAIPGRGQEKITRSMEFGGLPLQVQTVGAFTGVPLSFAVTTSFEGFKSLVNEMGGLHVHVPFTMFDRSSGADFHAGRTHMMGDGALSYARNRNLPGGDVRRTEHQGQLLVGALERAREVATSPLDVIRLLGMIARHTQLEGVGLRDLYSFVTLGLGIDPGNVRNVTMPARVGNVGPASVVFAGPGAQELFADFRDDAILQSH